jgi:hypothetical protein
MNLPEGTTTLLLGAGVVLASWLLLRGSRARWARSQRATANPDEVRRSVAEHNRETALRDAPPEVLRWHVELHETARDLKAEIDSKLAALSALTRLAREEADRLERLLEQVDSKQLTVDSKRKDAGADSS